MGKMLTVQAWQPLFRFPTPRLKLDMVTCLCNPIAKRQRPTGPGHLLDRQSSRNIERILSSKVCGKGT